MEKLTYWLLTVSKSRVDVTSAWSALPNTELILTAAGSDDSDPNPARWKRRRFFFLMYSNPQKMCLWWTAVDRNQGRSLPRGRSLCDDQPISLECIDTHTHTCKLLKCALHGCQWLYNSCRGSACVYGCAETVCCPVIARSVEVTSDPGTTFSQSWESQRQV